MENHNQLMGIRSINDFQKEGFGKMFGRYLREAWYFEKWYEKLILVVLGVLGLWKTIEFF